jgi:hypothetical protein
MADVFSFEMLEECLAYLRGAGGCVPSPPPMHPEDPALKPAPVRLGTVRIDHVYDLAASDTDSQSNTRKGYGE